MTLDSAGALATLFNSALLINSPIPTYGTVAGSSDAFFHEPIFVNGNYVLIQRVRTRK